MSTLVGKYCRARPVMTSRLLFHTTQEVEGKGGEVGCTEANRTSAFMAFYGHLFIIYFLM